MTLVGPNGAGKTTLIDTLAGVRPLARGKLSTGHNVKIGHLSQHAEDLGKGPGGRANKVVEACAVHTGLTPNKARALLGRFLFSGEEAEKPLDGLSGGERRRLSLAILVASGANVLILDEPTNHLDIESREALEDALLAFEGTLLLVSHDRALLEAVGTRTVAVDDGKLRSYEGGWQEYVRVREERRLAARAEKTGKGGAVAQGRRSATLGAAATRAREGRPRLRGEGHQAEPHAGEGQAAEAEGCDRSRSAPARSSRRRRRRRWRRRATATAPPGSSRRTPAATSASSSARSSRPRRRWPSSSSSSRSPTAWATPESSKESAARHAAAKREVEEAFARWEAASP